jgi:hypothetical protein
MHKQVHTPTGNVDRPPRRDERQGSRELDRDVKRDRKMEQQVDEAGEESFPASDPPGWTSGSSVAVREHKERAPGVSTVETVEHANVTGQSQAAGEAQPGQAKARGRDRGKAKQRPDKRADGPKPDGPKIDDEDTLDMSRDKDRGAQASREQRIARGTQSGAIPQPRGEDRNERHEAVQVNERKEQERTHLAPERTDDRTDLPGRRSASEGPHEVFPGEPRVTPPKPVMH